MVQDVRKELEGRVATPKILTGPKKERDSEADGGRAEVMRKFGEDTSA